MSLASFAVNKVIPLKKIEDFETYLFVGPHADDIEIGAGATVSKLVSMGKKVSFLICTDGRYGDTNSKGIVGQELIDIRKEEVLKAAGVLGVTDVHFLELIDGASYAREELERRIAEKFSEINPDIVFAPDPDSSSESHMDHLNVGEAVKKIGYFTTLEALMKEKHGLMSTNLQAVAFYMTTNVNRVVKVKKKDYLKQQEAIFDCHTSQYPKDSGDSKALSLYLKIRSVQYGLKKMSLYGEGFRMLDIIRMHCIPEAK